MQSLILHGCNSNCNWTFMRRHSEIQTHALLYIQVLSLTNTMDRCNQKLKDIAKCRCTTKPQIKCISRGGGKVGGRRRARIHAWIWARCFWLHVGQNYIISGPEMARCLIPWHPCINHILKCTIYDNCIFEVRAISITNKSYRWMEQLKSLCYNSH